MNETPRRTGSGWTAQIARALTAALAVLVGTGVAAQQAGPLPDDLQDIGIDQKPDARLPLGLEFTDESGRTVRLGRYFEDGRPVLLNLVYYRCPMLCGLVLDGMLESLKGLDWVAGDQFAIVTVSIDPLETPRLAKLKKQNYLRAYGRPGADRGWHFLTGSPASIEALADTVGFRYQYVEERKEYAHPAAIFVVTPDGRVSRYLFGIEHDPRTMRLSLVEAAEGKIGSIVDQFLLYCYRYDSEAGQYTPVAWRLMRVGGLLTVIVLGASLLAFWLRELRQRRTA